MLPEASAGVWGFSVSSSVPIKAEAMVGRGPGDNDEILTHTF